MDRLSEEQKERYLRQIIIGEVGEEGQLRLLAGRVVVIGAGGLGSPAGYYLAASGVGTIGLVDDGEVELSNLQRQILHNTAGLGLPKVESAAKTLNALNPEVRVIPYHLRLDRANARAIIKDFDLVVSALDNLETRYLVNEICVELGKPLIEGGVSGFWGMVTTIIPGQGPCFECLFPKPVTTAGQPEGSAPIPVFSTTPGVIGTLQAHEALKLLLGVGTPLAGRLLFFDGKSGSFSEQEVRREPDCPCCSTL